MTTKAKPLAGLYTCRICGNEVLASDNQTMARSIASDNFNELVTALEACIERGRLSPLTPNIIKQARTAILNARK
jgi:hypothetical protein